MNRKKSADRLVDRLKSLFINRTDTYAVQNEDGAYRRVDIPLTTEVLRQHLDGSVTVGSYQISPSNNSVKWICFDIDPERIKNVNEVASRLFTRVRKCFGEKSVLLEASRYSDPSYHIWAFFEQPVSAYIARHLSRRILKICRLEKTGIELFPKQDTISRDGFGNCVKMPLGIHRKHNKRSRFLDPEKMEPLPDETVINIIGAPCEEEIFRVFGRVGKKESKEIAVLLADYWLDFCNYSAQKVWNILKKWSETNTPPLSLSHERLTEVMRSVGKSRQLTNIYKDDSSERETDFQKQTIRLDRKAKIFDIPCIKAFRDTQIFPCKRHDILGKNFSILYPKIKGSFRGFSEFAASLTKNQPDFDERNLDWRKWVQTKPRSFNCIEVRDFLTRSIRDFSCTNCPIKVEAYYLHPAGGVNEFFVYEPIGQKEYVYKTVDGKKGICKLQKEKKKYFLTIEGQRFYFKEKPPESWFFNLPKRGTIQNWVDDKKKSKSSTQLWKEIQLNLQTFLDLPNKNEFSALALFVIQSWLTEIAKTVFYCGIQGEYGGGKTVCGETIIQMCRHGYQTGNSSPAFIARALEQQKLTLFIDELDSAAGSDDSDIYQILRQGYRRGSSYSRVNLSDMKTEAFQVFGPKIFSLHSSVEQALQTRTLTIHVQETENYKFPVIGPYRDSFLKEIHDELLLWYLDIACEIRNRQPEINRIGVDIVDQVDVSGEGVDQKVDQENISNAAEKLRERLFRQSTTYLSKGQLHQLSQLKGRNVELAYLMDSLSNLIGIDQTEQISKLFQQKATEESEQLEIGSIGILKDLLVNIWKEKSNDENYLTDTGYVKVSNKEIYDRLNDILRQKSLPQITSHEFKAYLTEFGFSDAVNRKKMKVLVPGENVPQSRLANIFTPQVLKKLEVDTEETAKKSPMEFPVERPSEVEG